MSEQEALEIQRRRRRRGRRLQNRSRYKIRVRYKYRIHGTIRTEDFGSFEEMYRKYRDEGYSFWCADLPPEFSASDGTWVGYRLDGDSEHTKFTLKRYGKHKAWVDTAYTYKGKPTILVYNAAWKFSSVQP